MQTVLFKKMDDYKIIIGYGKLSIDPVETQKVVDLFLKKDENVKRIENLNRQVEILKNQIRDIWKKQVKTKTEEEQLNDYKKQKEENLKEITNLGILVKKRKAELTMEKAVYFEPTKNEIIKTDKEVKILKAIKLNTNELLDIDGHIIPNWTMFPYWTKGEKWTVSGYKVGEVPPDGAKIYDDLTSKEKMEIEEQMELDRLALLSRDAKDNEKKDAIENIGVLAAQKKAGLEFGGMEASKALEEAQTWYDEQVEIIKNKYK